MEDYATTNSAASNYEIVTGFWTNWSRGLVFGQTLTLTRRDGDLLIAFIALFVTIVGTSFWRIVCFGLHTTFSTDSTRDGVYHQRQAILRNSANGASGLCRFASAMWAWRNRDSKPFRRIGPLIVFTTLFIFAFGVASGFSSKVSTGVGNEVLIQTPDFGISVGKNLTWAQTLKIWYPLYSRTVLSHSTYAQQCYTNDTSTANCNKYVKPRLDARIQRNASCPFDADMCKLPDQNVLLDTGLLDFNDDFGVNLPPKWRFQYRQTMHCAPIVTDGYKEAFPEKNETWYGDEDRTWKKPAHTVYYYGQAPFENVTNATYEYQTDIPDMTVKLNTAPAFYSLGTRQVYGSNGTVMPDSAFDPMPALRRPDADMVLVFLSANEIAYIGPVNDPWYSANAKYSQVKEYENEHPGKIWTYYRDEPASVLGCVIQKQICNPRMAEDKRCTPLGPTADLSQNLETIVEGDGEAWWLKQLTKLLLVTLPELWDIINTLGSSSLSASFSLTNGVQAVLPSDQWQRDVERWHSIMMATLQGSAVEVAEGPSAPELRAELQKPTNSWEKALCRRQKILSTAHSNFSVFGLAFIFVTGGLAILVSWLLEPIIAFVQQRRKLDSYSRLEWCANETLQLQRLAHEELGMGTWSKCDGDVPVTEKGERLAVLDLTDVTHPRLKARPMGWEEIVARGPVGSTVETKDTGSSTERDDSSCKGCGGKGARVDVEEINSPSSSSASGSDDRLTLAEASSLSSSLDNRHIGNCRLEDGRDGA